MALLALVLWCCSLPLNVFSAGIGGDFFGLSVLLVGWLSPLVLNACLAHAPIKMADFHS